MKIRVISKTHKKAEIITIEPTTYGDVYTTRHLWFVNGRWRDKPGNYYDI